MSQKWTVCGQGTLKHPVTGESVTTEVVELEGWGRIGEWYDYSDSPELTIALISAAPELLEALKALADNPSYINLNKARWAIRKAEGK